MIGDRRSDFPPWASKYDLEMFSTPDLQLHFKDVPKLEGINNYFLWKISLEAILNLTDGWSAISLSELEIIDETEVERRELNCKAWIIMTVGSHLLKVVMRDEDCHLGHMESRTRNVKGEGKKLRPARFEEVRAREWWDAINIRMREFGYEEESI